MEGFFFVLVFVVGCLAIGLVIGALVGKAFVFVFELVTQSKEKSDE